MKRLPRPFFIAIGIGTALMVCIAAWLMLRPVPQVTVVVKNMSAKPITSVRLEHEHGVEIAEELAPGGVKTMRFKVRGETTWHLRVRFADGSEVAGGGGYAEAGYEFFEAVGDSSIKTETRLPHY
jgi:hypothetical protein